MFQLHYQYGTIENIIRDQYLIAIKYNNGIKLYCKYESNDLTNIIQDIINKQVKLLTKYEIEIDNNKFIKILSGQLMRVCL